ncbi:MAG: sulfurtransferase TusA family protein [Candidatus Omnitrophica bacterium]|nr:sulfurtransferase TusA family protein [Candidatus Omnitrophota bacterium]
MSKIKPDATLNLEGVTCPTNFVRTKLKLEEMGTGEVLEIIIDDGEPVKNVPRSVKEDGHKIIHVEKFDNRWKLLIEKV